MANIVKYFQGIDPIKPDGMAGLREIHRPTPNQIHARFSRSLLTDGTVTARIRWSRDLAAWHEGGTEDAGTTVLIDETQTAPDPTDGDREIVSVLASIQGTIPASFHLRLEVSWLPPPVLPEAPQTLPPSDVTPGGFTARWSPVPNAEGYLVDVATDPHFITPLPAYQAVDAASSTSLPVTGLATNSVYYYRVRAYNNAGTGSASTVAQATTQLMGIVTPQQYTVQEPTGVTFMANVPGNAPVSYRWEKSNLIFLWNPVPGAIGPMLIISPTNALMDGDRYRCIVTNAVGSVILPEVTLRVLPNPPPPELTVSQTSWTAPATGGGTSIGVFSNTSWTAISNQGWLTISPPSGSGNGSIFLNAAPNAGLTQRTATVTVSGGGITRTIHATQPGAEPFIDVNLGFSPILPPPGGGTHQGTVSSNVAWSAQTSAWWLTVSPQNGGPGLTSITISLAPNSSAASRTASVQFSGGGITRTFTFSQAAPAVLEVAQSHWTVSSSGGQTSIAISANVPWTAQSNQNWLSVSPANGNGHGAITLQADSKMITMIRDATVTVSGGGFTRTILVTQP